MPDFNVRSDSINVEQIMEQIRARVREKRGADYTEEQIRQLATVKLEKFLDPRGVRSDLLDEFRRAQVTHQPPAPPNYAFEDQTLFESTRAPVRWIRRLLLPILKLFFNPNPLIQALHIQARLNTMYAQHETLARGRDQLHYEVLHNLVVEMTRTGIEVKNLKMQVESLASRLEFNERRARSLESVVVYKPSADQRVEVPARREPRVEEAPVRETAAPRDGTPAPVPAPAAATSESPGQRSRRRRRRRGRRSGASAAGMMGGGADVTAENPLTEEEGADGGGEVVRDDDTTQAAEQPDQRLMRPEPFQQTFGADTHPAEPVVADPAGTPAPSPRSTPGGADEPQ
jgi:hypothetical protein